MALTAASTAWLARARGRSWKIFWLAFGGGMALRLAGLAGLMAVAWRGKTVSAEALLASYALGTLTFLMIIEHRYIIRRQG